MKSEILRQLFFVVGWTSITFANPPKFIQSGAATIAYYEEGRREGTPLVVIAGGPGFDHDYLRIGKGWDQLIAEHRVVFYDQRGTGHSSPVTPEISITVTDFVADLEALREALNAKSLDLLEHSCGGYFAMAYATAHADRVRHLILVDSAGPKMTDDVVTLFGQIYPDKGAVLPDWSKKSLEGYLSLLFHSPENRKAWLPQAAKVGFNPLVFEKLSSKPPDLTSEISKLKVPTLILHGRHDMNVAPITGWTLHQAIKDSQIIFFESSGHLPFFEEPELFGRAVGHFITDN